MTNIDDKPGHNGKPCTSNHRPANTDEQPSDTGKDSYYSDANRPTEHGGPKGLEPTRYGDWERNSRCTDF